MFDQIEKNPWILALAIIVSNIGAKFIYDDLSDKQQEILNSCFLRKIYIFTLVFAGTQNLMISVISTLLYALIIHWL